MTFATRRIGTRQDGFWRNKNIPENGPRNASRYSYERAKFSDGYKQGNSPSIPRPLCPRRPVGRTSEGKGEPICKSLAPLAWDRDLGRGVWKNQYTAWPRIEAEFVAWVLCSAMNARIALTTVWMRSDVIQ